jgi:hypothetical protein
MVRKRARLQSLLPLVSTDKAVDVRYEIALLDQKLGPTNPAYAKPQPELESSASGVNGVAGLMFEVQAPPGQGRLVRVPLYLYSANFNQLSFQAPQVGPMVITGAGANQVDEANPTVIVTMPNDPSGRRVLSGFSFRTPVMEWAKLRVVGLEVTQVHSVYGGNAIPYTAGVPGPVPGSPANVSFYDVGPGSGATGRYNSFAVKIDPLPSAVATTVLGGDQPLNSIPWGPGPLGGFPVSPRVLSFDYVEVGTSVSISVSFKNNFGVVPVNLAFALIPDPSITIDAVPGVTQVPVGGVTTISFTFTPSSFGLTSTSVQLWWQRGSNPLAIVTIPIVGFGAPNNYYKNGQLYLLLKNLSIGGGANLLSQDGYIDATIYDARTSDYAGLRAYPELVSPNRASIDVAVVGPQLASLTFSINLVCDVLADREYGDPSPGPYSRDGALARLESATPNTVVR